MRTHTNEFKTEILKNGRQINGKIYHYFNYDLITENGDEIISEKNDNLILEQYDKNNNELLTEEDIYSIKIIKNGELLQSLMKQLNFEAKNDIKTGDVVNPQLGLLVNNSYEYLDYGNYIIYSKSYNAKNETWEYVCYDNMLYSMIQYTRLNVSYPITVKEYINAIAKKMGIGFANELDSFTNDNQLIYEDYFKGKNTSYRHILDKLSEITASNILINDNDELEIGYVKQTDDTIDKDYLKSVSVNFGKTFGVINKVCLLDTQNKLKYVAQDDISIEQNKLTQINITDNPIALHSHQDIICQNILNQIKDISYSINDFTTTGVCYYDFLEKFNVDINGNIYNCLLLNNEITITQGIEEVIFTDKKSNSEEEMGNYETNNLTNRELKDKYEQLENNKISNNSVINSINESEESSIIKVEKMLMIKKTTGATNNDGFLNINLNNDFVVVSATANFNTNDYGFIIPYYDYNNGNPIWKLKIENKNKQALANTQITVTVYYFKKERND